MVCGREARAEAEKGPEAFEPPKYLASLIASINGADLRLAHLQGAHLTKAHLQGAHLGGAQLQGADFFEAWLQGADLRGAELWQTTFGHESDLSLSDLRSAQFKAPTERERAEVVASFDAIPDVAWGKKVAARVEKALTPQTPAWPGISGVAVDKFVLVDDLRDVRWGAIHRTKRQWTGRSMIARSPLNLAKLAETDEFVAKGIAKRLPLVFDYRVLWPDLARRLLDGRKDGKIKLPNDVATRLESYYAAPPAAGAAAAKP